MSYPDVRYFGDKGEISATFRPSDQKPDLLIGYGTVVCYLATGASTHGQFGLYRWDAKPHTPGPSLSYMARPIFGRNSWRSCSGLRS